MKLIRIGVLTYGGSIVNSTDSWNLVGGDYVWIVDIETTTPTSPSSVGTRIIWAANLCTGIGDYMSPVTWTECDTPPTPIDTTPCDICYDVTTDPCGETIFLPGLDADTTYTLTMTDNNAGVSYTYEVTTDETGEASVIIAESSSNVVAVKFLSTYRSSPNTEPRIDCGPTWPAAFIGCKALNTGRFVVSCAPINAPHGQYLGLVQQRPIISASGNYLVCLDVDMKHASGPTNVAIQRMAKFVKQKKMLTDGVFTINEVRRQEDYNTIGAAGDVHLVQVNQMDLNSMQDYSVKISSNPAP